MKLLKHTLDGFFYQHWTFLVAFSYFFKGLARELNIAPATFLNWHQNIVIKTFKKRWQRINSQGGIYFEINGAIFPDFSSDKQTFYSLASMVFDDTFLVPCFYNDNHDSTIIDKLDKHMVEGPYGYKKDLFNVTISKNDVVIDAGAWIGDFSAYAASKGANTYAFEPVEETFHLLCKTAKINKGEIHPIKKGLGSEECEINIFTNKDHSGSNSLIIKNEKSTEEKISITTLDRFIEENKLERVDFIKADIEGAERDMLKGATNILKTFAPKLAICTYHLPDDPEVLEKIILEANPNYKIVQLQHKLFAAVIN
ncbi:MAG: FkbM family methyltransferase [Candidatus Azobacteroides sp.]|nr:FkbM family methyltransferase [Candidatus Azobacteroides sp.]